MDTKKMMILLLGLVCLTTTKAAFPSYPNKAFKSIKAVGIIQGLSDEQLMETVQKQTFRYFWDFAHPVSGLARERNNTVKGAYYWDYINELDTTAYNFSLNTYGNEACAIGGSGFGILSLVVATERGWITRDAALERLHKIVEFLLQAETFHGAFPHFMNGETGKPVTFGRLDEGGDIVETSYLFMGLLTARAYFNQQVPLEKYLREKITQMWETMNWEWYENDSKTLLYWHWSPNQGFDMNFPIRGWNEALITYIMAASSPTHPISANTYYNCWVNSSTFRNGQSYYGIKLPLCPYSMGGPLFYEQYTFMGIDPNGLTGVDVDYFEQARNHALIQHQYSIENPKKFKGYGDNCWGLTAGDNDKGYLAHDPTWDTGVIQPTAALSSMAVTPEESMKAMRHFYYALGDKIWGEYGFMDGFNETTNWQSNTYLAIDQGPIICMIENYRTQLLWKLFMNIPEVQNGLKKLNFESPYIKK